jgi:acetyl esterase/lipase
MTFHILSILLLPLALLLSACATHIGKPAGPPPQRLDVPVVVRKNLVYTPADWPQPILADIYTPQLPQVSSRPLPAVLMIHGGAWSSGDRPQTAYLSRRVAARGYVVVNATYRLVPGAIFPAQLLDLQQALHWMRANAATLGIDPNRIGVWGYSAGAHLAALIGGLSPGDRLYDPDATVKAVVAGGTPADLRKFHGGTLVPAFLGQTWTEDSVVFREASPAAYVTPGDPPVFLYHGTWDALVPLDQSTDYQAALDAAGIPNELYLMRGFGHIAAFLMDGGAVQQGSDFLDRHLRDGQ